MTSAADKDYRRSLAEARVTNGRMRDLKERQLHLARLIKWWRREERHTATKVAPLH